MDQVRIQVLFTEETQYGSYTDALYYGVDTWPVDEVALSEAKAARVQNYISAVESAPAPVEPTQEDLQNQIDIIGKQLTELAQKAAELGVKLDVSSINTDSISSDVKLGGV